MVYDVGNRKSFDFARRVLKTLSTEKDCNNNNNDEYATDYHNFPQIKQRNSQINLQALQKALVELEKYQNENLESNNRQWAIPRTDSPMIKTPNVILIGNKRDMQVRFNKGFMESLLMRRW